MLIVYLFVLASSYLILFLGLRFFNNRLSRAPSYACCNNLTRYIYKSAISVLVLLHVCSEYCLNISWHLIDYLALLLAATMQE